MFKSGFFKRHRILVMSRTLKPRLLIRGVLEHPKNARSGVFLIFIALILLIILGFLGFKLYLYIQYLIGNDLVVQLSADNRDVSLVYGENTSVNFKMSKVTSPLCKTMCEYLFLDVSNNISLDKNNFSLGQLSQNQQEKFLQNKLGKGQEIYRFTLVCKNVRTILCHTNELPISRDILVTFEYGPNEKQINAKNLLAQRVYSAFNDTNTIDLDLTYLQLKLNDINKTLLIENNIPDLKFSANKINNNFEAIKESWLQEDYVSVNKTLYKINIDKDKLLSDFIFLNKTIYSKIEQYNSLVDALSLYSSNLSDLLAKEMNETDALTLGALIENFNIQIDLFLNSSNLQDKINITSLIIKNNLSNFTIANGTFKAIVSESNIQTRTPILYPREIGKSLKINFSRYNNTLNFNLSYINLSIPAPITKKLVLQDSKPECCVYNKCKPCGKVDGAYPIIFIHGHDFNKDISAEYSLNIFQSIQNKFDSDGFLNAGQLTLYDLDSETSGLLGLSGVPVTVRATYYYDVLKESNSIYLPVQVKSENIDTYSIKLRTLIDKLKYETGQPKVTIVAHSMGGLVARRYIQIFGNESVDKLILVAVPNNGITGNIVSLCSVFGTQAECNDLTSGSLFLNKLNNDNSQNVNTYNIIGTGCPMNGGEGDGIVLSKNAVLNNSKEYSLNGSCSGIDFLHVEMLKTDKYPELYRILKSILNESKKSFV